MQAVEAYEHLLSLPIALCLIAVRPLDLSAFRVCRHASTHPEPEALGRARERDWRPAGRRLPPLAQKAGPTQADA